MAARRLQLRGEPTTVSRVPRETPLCNEGRILAHTVGRRQTLTSSVSSVNRHGKRTCSSHEAVEISKSRTKLLQSMKCFVPLSFPSQSSSLATKERAKRRSQFRRLLKRFNNSNIRPPLKPCCSRTSTKRSQVSSSLNLWLCRTHCIIEQ